MLAGRCRMGCDRVDHEDDWRANGARRCSESVRSEELFTEMGKQYVLAMLAVSALLLAVGYMSIYEISKNDSTLDLLQRHLRRVISKIWAGGNNKLSRKLGLEKHRQALEYTANRHKSIRSKLKSMPSQIKSETTKLGARTPSKSALGLYTKPRRIRGWVGGPSTPAGRFLI